jgi:hypothetical protein
VLTPRGSTRGGTFWERRRRRDRDWWSRRARCLGADRGRLPRQRPWRRRRRRGWGWRRPSPEAPLRLRTRDGGRAPRFGAAAAAGVWELSWDEERREGEENTAGSRPGSIPFSGRQVRVGPLIAVGSWSSEQTATDPTAAVDTSHGTNCWCRRARARVEGEIKFGGHLFWARPKSQLWILIATSEQTTLFVAFQRNIKLLNYSLSCCFVGFFMFPLLWIPYFHHQTVVIQFDLGQQQASASSIKVKSNAPCLMLLTSYTHDDTTRRCKTQGTQHSKM